MEPDLSLLFVLFSSK